MDIDKPLIQWLYSYFIINQSTLQYSKRFTDHLVYLFTSPFYNQDTPQSPRPKVKIQQKIYLTIYYPFIQLTSIMNQRLIKISTLSSLIFMLIFMSQTVISMKLDYNIVSLNQQYKNTNCQPNGKCLSCMNDRICKECIAGQKCCPKNCLQCENNFQCLKCQQGFEMFRVPQNNLKICVNQVKMTDNKQIINIRPSLFYQQYPNTQSCLKGTYLDIQSNTCKRCLVQNCQTCQDSMSCNTCSTGFYLAKDHCLSWNNFQQYLNNLSKDEQNQDSIYVGFLFMGAFFGFCFACILMKVYTCTKKRCQSFYRKIRNSFSKNQTNNLIEQKDQNTLQIPTLNDELNQYSQSMKNAKKINAAKTTVENNNFMKNSDDVVTEG